MPGPYHPGYVTKGDFSSITSTQEHELGTWGYNRGRVLEYVKFSQSLQKYNWVGRSITDTTVDRGRIAAMLVDQATHAPIGVAEYGGTANSFGWVTRYGPATAKTGTTTSCQGGALSNTAAATGTLATFASATFAQIAHGAGILVGTPSASGTYVDVRCL